ncbi:MAG TPA: PAS domain S-box protein, partial [Firmicutes bacterium]|nr:PAS domain S-box protein [Bacillota bacterium]
MIRAINEAIRLARTIRSEKARTNQFKTILEYISDGVLAVNSKGEVTVYNKAAENIIGVAKRNVLGRPAQEVIQNTRMHEVLETGIEEVGVLQEIGNTTIVTNRTPILVDSKTVGAVATFQNVTELQQMEQQVRRKLSRRGLMAKWSFADIIGNSPVMKKTVKRALKFAEVDNTILLFAETGSGKEIFAQSIHQRSKRKNSPFVAINCAALPETLLEGELFGYAEGAFTGAVKGGKAGLFELAHGGTIFLDEIGEMSKHLQTLFLRVLQEKEVRRVGDDRVIPVDVRVIAASNQDLGIMVQEGKFRADLYYRINVLNLEIPPLRERRDDIPLLAANILSNFNRRSMIKLTFAPEAFEVLKSYFWPGNVRQLENVLERLFVIAEDNIITGSDVE